MVRLTYGSGLFVRWFFLVLRRCPICSAGCVAALCVIARSGLPVGGGPRAFGRRSVGDRGRRRLRRPRRVGLTTAADTLTARTSSEWRNRQTRQVEGLVPVKGVGVQVPPPTRRFATRDAARHPYGSLGRIERHLDAQLLKQPVPLRGVSVPPRRPSGRPGATQLRHPRTPWDDRPVCPLRPRS